MSIFSNLKSDVAMEDNTPTSTGGNFGPVESGVYESVIEMAYVDKSKGGALNVNFVFKTADSKEIKQTVYVTSGDAKGNLNYYLDKEGNQRYLPGYNVVNALCLLTVGKELTDMDTEEKVLSLYNFEQRKEVPSKKQVLMDLLGQKVKLGVLEVREFKRVRGDDGVYRASEDTRSINEIDKVFRSEDGLCVAEIRAEETEAAELNRWVSRNEGNVRDKTKGKAQGPTSKAPEGTAPKGLFG